MHTITTNGTSRLRPGMELLVTKWIALGGTARIVREKEEILLQKLPWALVREAKNFAQYEGTEREWEVIKAYKETEVFSLGTGGILTGLWQIADQAGLGLTADLRKIPIRQETIEVCELFDVNPYNLDSTGALLIGTDSAMEMKEELERAKIPCTIIGRIQESAERVLYNQEIKRYIEKPQKDEIYKVVGK